MIRCESPRLFNKTAVYHTHLTLHLSVLEVGVLIRQWVSIRVELLLSIYLSDTEPISITFTGRLAKNLSLSLYLS